MEPEPADQPALPGSGSSRGAWPALNVGYGCRGRRCPRQPEPPHFSGSSHRSVGAWQPGCDCTPLPDCGSGCLRTWCAIAAADRRIAWRACDGRAGDHAWVLTPAWARAALPILSSPACPGNTSPSRPGLRRPWHAWRAPSDPGQGVGGRVHAPSQPADDAPPEELAAWQRARKQQSSQRICVECRLPSPSTSGGGRCSAGSRGPLCQPPR